MSLLFIQRQEGGVAAGSGRVDGQGVKAWHADQLLQDQGRGVPQQQAGGLSTAGMEGHRYILNFSFLFHLPASH